MWVSSPRLRVYAALRFCYYHLESFQRSKVRQFNIPIAVPQNIWGWWQKQQKNFKKINANHNLITRNLSKNSDISQVWIYLDCCPHAKHQKVSASATKNFGKRNGLLQNHQFYYWLHTAQLLSIKINIINICLHCQLTLSGSPLKFIVKFTDRLTQRKDISYMTLATGKPKGLKSEDHIIHRRILKMHMTILMTIKLAINWLFADDVKTGREWTVKTRAPKLHLRHL